MTENAIKQEHGRYFIENSDGKTIAELLYSEIAGKNAISIDSIRVDPDYRGHGLASRILKQAVSDAAAVGKRVKPVCPYAKAAFLKNPEYAKLTFKA
ncbi:MAG: GNAT family N-acetyltransferase [Oenococcus sp.]|uniref:GNAT family N-acetyltransferase n=1 Tax=Oenococcus sp. TaxID=1979414 RepID=UPI0039ED7CC4